MALKGGGGRRVRRHDRPAEKILPEEERRRVVLEVAVDLAADGSMSWEAALEEAEASMVRVERRTLAKMRAYRGEPGGR